MSIVHPNARGFDELAQEGRIIRRYQAQRAGELQGLRGFRRWSKHIEIYWWARGQAIPEILADRKRKRHERRHCV